MAPVQAAPADIAQGSLNSCTWIGNGMDYAVVAAASDQTLDQITDRSGGRSACPAERQDLPTDHAIVRRGVTPEVSCMVMGHHDSEI